MDARVAAPAPSTSRLARLAAGAILATFSLLPVADAADRPIVAVEARSLVSRDGRDLERDLREAVVRELSGLDFQGATRSERYVLAASLLKLDTRAEAGKVRANAKVSVLLRAAKGGAVHAIIDGSALAEDAETATARAESGALDGAVRGALRAVPEAVRRASK